MLLTFKTINVVPLMCAIFGVAIILILLFFYVSTSKKRKGFVSDDAGVVIDETSGNIEQLSEPDESTFDDLDFPQEEMQDASQEEDVLQEQPQSSSLESPAEEAIEEEEN